MAKKQVIKDSTLTYIRELLTEHGSEEAVRASDRFKSLHTHFFNSYERDNIDIIFKLIIADKTNSEIRHLIKNKTEDDTDDDIVNPVEAENDNIFILHDNMIDNNQHVSASKKDEGEYLIFVNTEEIADKDKSEASPIVIINDNEVDNDENPKTDSEEYLIFVEVPKSDKTDNTLNDSTGEVPKSDKTDNTSDDSTGEVPKSDKTDNTSNDSPSKKTVDKLSGIKNKMHNLFKKKTEDKSDTQLSDTKTNSVNEDIPVMIFEETNTTENKNETSPKEETNIISPFNAGMQLAIEPLAKLNEELDKIIASKKAG